jgi:soluble lytic murein transglycosylase-like protein
MDKIAVLGIILTGVLLFGTPMRGDESARLAAPANDPRLALWQADIAAASRRFDVPEDWIRAVILSESGGRLVLNGRPITSSAGAMGLMQIMPATWSELRLRYGLGNNPYDPHDNILAGTAYLHELYQLYGYPNLFAAYNAGPSRLDAYLNTGTGLPDETLHYLASLDAKPSNVSPQFASSAPSSLFFSLGISAGKRSPVSSTKDLFIP